MQLRSYRNGIFLIAAEQAFLFGQPAQAGIGAGGEVLEQLVLGYSVAVAREVVNRSALHLIRQMIDKRFISVAASAVIAVNAGATSTSLSPTGVNNGPLLRSNRVPAALAVETVPDLNC